MQLEANVQFTIILNSEELNGLLNLLAEVSTIKSKLHPRLHDRAKGLLRHLSPQIQDALDDMEILVNVKELADGKVNKGTSPQGGDHPAESRTEE